MMMAGASFRRWVSFFMLIGVVSAYTLRTWHDPSFHAHHTPCQAGADGHWHEGEHHCPLCDFTLVLALPASDIPGVQDPSVEGVHPLPVWTDRRVSAYTSNTGSRGPPTFV